MTFRAAIQRVLDSHEQWQLAVDGNTAILQDWAGTSTPPIPSTLAAEAKALFATIDTDQAADHEEMRQAMAGDGFHTAWGEWEAARINRPEETDPSGSDGLWLALDRMRDALILQPIRKLESFGALTSRSVSMRQIAKTYEWRRPDGQPDVSKVHEEIIRGTLPEVSAHFTETEARGEVTVCVAGRAAGSNDASEGPEALAERVEALDRESLGSRLAALLADGTPRNEALRQIAGEQRVPRREVYKLLMIEKEETP